MTEETLCKAKQLEMEIWYLEETLKELKKPNIDELPRLTRHIPTEILNEWIATLATNTREILSERLAQVKAEFENL